MDLDLATNLKNIAMDFYQGNIGSANSKYFNELQKLETYEPFIKNAEKVLKLQENEDWVAIGDFFFYITET
ncbi:MAG: hypothetical protein LBH25_13110 [Fibromonadaceae bacterium]|jgi:hypothetical protein|nr:hypothetical protein [Fibromonadaceae bacterium]